MKNIRFLTFVLTLTTLVLSACGAVAATPTAAPEAAASAKVDALPVAFVGIIDSIAGDQWVISGTTVTVDASIIRNGPFNVGDQVKVEGFVHPDGSFSPSRVETPTPQETATLPPFVDDNSNDALTNANTNDANANSNDSSTNDDNSNGVNSNDDNSTTANSNDDNSSSVNSNDDNSSNTNINDDNSSSVNSNDDNSNSADTNDDHGGSNSNDNAGNDNSSGGGSNSNGGDDKGGNGNDG